MIKIYADYAIIGTNLEVKEKVAINISDNGYVIRVNEHSPKNHYDYTFEDSVVVPGFVNLHTHIGDSFAKEAAYGYDVARAVGSGNSLKWRLYEEISEDRIIEGMKRSLLEMLSSGTTTFVDFREGGVNGVNLLKKALKNVKVKAIILGRGTNGDWETVLKVSDGFGLSSLNNFDDETIKKLYQKAYLSGKYFSFHASETKEQRTKSISKFIQAALSSGITFTQPNFIVHAVHADLMEIKKLAEMRIPVIICFRSNLYLKAGVPPLKQFVENRVLLGVGTDNVMVSPPDLFQELQSLIRYSLSIGLKLNVKFFLRLVTRNAAMILNKPIGLLDEGFHADFFVFDLTRPNVAGMENIIQAIVLRGKSENVIKTFVDGKIVFER